MQQHLSTLKKNCAARHHNLIWGFEKVRYMTRYICTAAACYPNQKIHQIRKGWLRGWYGLLFVKRNLVVFDRAFHNRHLENRLKHKGIRQCFQQVRQLLFATNFFKTSYRFIVKYGSFNL